MTPLPLSSTAALSSFAPQASATTSSPSGSSSSDSSQQSQNLASQNVFLQLLVAQLQNQDPEQPTDGTQFVTELAQFTTLQEDTQSATDLNTLVTDFASLGAGSGTGATGATNAAQTTPANTPKV